jgi:hypothetical protein
LSDNDDRVALSDFLEQKPSPLSPTVTALIHSGFSPAALPAGGF